MKVLNLVLGIRNPKIIITYGVVRRENIQK